MIVIKVELHSAVTNKVTSLGTMTISNNGTGDSKHGNYIGNTISKNMKRNIRKGSVDHWDRINKPVWNLILKMLINMGYDK